MDALFSGATSASDGQLSRIAQLLAEEHDTKCELDTANEMARAAKERLNDLHHSRIPEAMAQAGVTEFKDEKGLKAVLAFSADGALGSPSTPEEHAERERKLDIIEAHGGAEIIKMTVTVEFPKDLFPWAQKCAAKVVEWLTASGLKGVSVSRLRTIHHQTLKKWIKDRMEAGAELPLDDLGIWYGQIAKITRPKDK